MRLPVTDSSICCILGLGILYSGLGFCDLSAKGRNTFNLAAPSLNALRNSIFARQPESLSFTAFELLLK